jgi:chorismate mutase/prephenate dehydratase
MTDSACSFSPSVLACLGPEGSFSYLLTQMRFPNVPVRAMATVGEVFDLMAVDAGAMGIVPIENSSGGFIVDTVDRLVDEGTTVRIVEELTLNVKLALLGKSGAPIEVVYSHAMPFFHSDAWLRANLPNARRVAKPSTAISAALAASETGAAAIGPRQNAERHALEILHYPIAGEVQNITQFFLLGHEENRPTQEHNRTALVVDLPDRPGSLCRFLTPLSDAGVNMKRLESRPLRGQPNKYRFYIEIEGSLASPIVAEALARTRDDGAQVRSLGSYSSGLVFES